jgi:hypothetical protein
MTLLEQRILFTSLLPNLIQHVATLGLQCVADQVKRTQAEADANAASGAGIKNSLHLLGLAIDLQLYRNGVWLTETESYRDLGEYWESLHELNRWGGRLDRPDADHFSSERDGVR